ncbi:NnrU family protein [Paraburkholderia megapolitana]|uniref:NnrU protein n=1 Tax=Paraburkholderia megapolitana TaxID=420953 RepID=A0A1I3E1H4_9BURK|nr:NnrU family protein [Paraburkholderia megapolitana]QDQ79870.1 NnrU family protein [Paraburkholderia megapolitana]SFH92688.1 NnrU protein [Paraburkholderia megapolitana]
MPILIAGLVIFLGIHSISIVAPRWRDAQVARMGANPWRGLYSVVSIVSLAAVIYGYGIARRTPVMLYAPPVALQHLTLLLMLPVFPLLIAAYVPGRVKRLARHPMLLAVILWAAAHLLANGTLNDVLLFGAFLVWAVGDLISVGRRPNVRAVPSVPASAVNDVIVVVAGLGLYAYTVLSAHVHVIGVAPLG